MTITVLVTGATGFIAQHIIKLLLLKKYSVVGTVRSIEKGNLLQRLFDSKSFTYEVVSRLEVPGSFDQAFKRHMEITVVLHVASPLNFSISDIESELLLPAIEGTRNLLNAIKKYGPQVQDMVVTSSAAAHFDFTRMTDPEYFISEDSWSPVTWEQSLLSPFLGYYGSKKFAEQVAWDFYREENPGYTLNSISPVYVFGPQAFPSSIKDELNYSSEIINKFLKLNHHSEIPFYSGGFVDVRDVARAHLAAFEKGFSQQRLLVISEPFTSQKLLDILHSNFDSLKHNLPTCEHETSQEPGTVVASFNNQKTRDLLGFPLIDLKTSVVDSVAQILKAKRRESSPPGVFLHKENRRGRFPTTFE